MSDIGIRELKTRASEIVREVRDERIRYVITYRGQPVAVLMPFDEAPQPPPEQASIWDELMRLGEQIGRDWQAPENSTEILATIRR